MSLIDLARSRQHDSAFSYPSPDYGPVHAFATGLQSGYDTSLTGMAARALKYWNLKARAANVAHGHKPEELYKDFLTKEEFDRDYSAGGALQFEPHYKGLMFREYAEALWADHLEDEWNMVEAGRSGRHAGWNLLGSLTTSILSPVDLAINVALPAAAPVRWGMGATVASRAGTGAARFVARTANSAINGAAQGILQQPAMMFLADQNQTRYGIEDIVANVAASPIMGAVGGMLHGGLMHAGGEWDREFANAVIADPALAAKIAANDPRVAAQMEFRKAVKNAVAKGEKVFAPKDGSDIHPMAGGLPEKLSDLDENNFLPPESRYVKTPEDKVDRIRGSKEIPPKDFGAIEAGARKVGAEGRPIDSTSHAPEPQPIPKVKRLIAEILENPEDPRIGDAVSDDEKFLAEAWQEMFGVRLRFFNEDLARSLGVRGWIRGSDPTTAFIMRGAMNDRSSNSMIFLAGHELAHTVRLRDPEMWRTVVTAIMRTAKEDGGALDRAWFENAQANRNSAAWADLNIAGRMDEAFATVLGQSMQNRGFWSKMYMASPRHTTWLRQYLGSLLNRIKGYLPSYKSPAILQLHDELAKALMAADESGTLATKTEVSPLWKNLPGANDAEKLSNFYAPWGDEIRGFTRRMATFMNEVGLKEDKKLAKFMEWADTLMPRVAKFSDQSATPINPGRFTVVLRNKQIDSNNPALFLLTKIFSGMGWVKDANGKIVPSPELQLAWAFKSKILEWDGVSLDANGKPDYASSVFSKHVRKDKRTGKEFSGPRYNNLVEFKKNADGTWDIAIYKNDDFPKWHEIVEKALNHTEDTAKESYHDFVNFEVLDMVRKFLTRSVQEQSELLDKGTVLFSDKAFDEFASYWRTIPNEERMILLARKSSDEKGPARNGLHDVWRGFAEYIEKKMNDGLMWNDPEAYKNLDELRSQIDPLMRTHEAGTVTAKAKLKAQEKLEKAWAELAAESSKMKQMADEEFLKSDADNGLTPLNWDQMTEPPVEYFKDLAKQIRMEVENELHRYSVLIEELKKVAENPANEDVRYLVRVNGKSKLYSPADAAEFKARMKTAIDAEVISRLRMAWPNIDRMTDLVELTKIADADKIALDANLTEFPAAFKEAVEQFDRPGLTNPMTDLSDDFFAMAGGPESLTDHVASNNRTVEQAIRLTHERLDREVQAWSKYTDSFVEASKADVEERLAAVGLEGWKLEEVKKPASEGAEAPKLPVDHPLLPELERIRADYDEQMAALKRLAARRKIPEGDVVLDFVQDRILYHRRQGLDFLGAVAATRADITADAHSSLIRVLKNHQADTGLMALAKSSLDQLYSYLDGSPRKGVSKAGASVAEEMAGNASRDVAPFMQDLLATGLDTNWLNNDLDTLRLFMRHMMQDNLGDLEDPRLRRLATTLQKIHKVQVGRLNHNGARVRLLPGYVFPQTHNALAIARAGEEWFTRIYPWIDWQAMERVHGKIYDRDAFLRAIHAEIGDPKKPLPDFFDEETMGGNLAARNSHRRVIYFKDTFALDYDMEFGSGNTSGHIISSIQRRAEAYTAMDHFGSDIKRTWASVMRKLGRAGAWRFEKLGRIDGTWQGLVGNLNHPDDVRIAALGRAARQYVNTVATWMAGVSSITDLGNATSALTWMGVSPKDLNENLGKLLLEYATKGPENRAILAGQGAGMEALLSAFTRTQMVRGKLFRMAETGSDITFKYSGQQIWSTSLQTAFYDLASKHLGSMADRSPSPELMTWLSHYGITREDWGRISAHARVVDGLEGMRIMPDMIEDEILAGKLRVAMMDTMHQAVLQPSVSNRAVLTFYTKAGTPIGEAIRVLNQFKGYPLAMVTRVHRRFANAYGNENITKYGVTMNKGTLAQLAWAGSMLSLAATVLAIKDVLRGREPLNPFDTQQWTLGNAARIVSQAGVGPLAVAEQFLSTRQMIGPGYGIASNVLTALGEGNEYQRTNAILNSLPLSSIIPAKEGAKALLATIHADTYGVHYQNYLRLYEQETGQSHLLLDNPKK